MVGEYGIPGLTGISNWLDELLSRYVGYNSQSIRDQFMYLRLIFHFLPTINVVPLFENNLYLYMYMYTEKLDSSTFILKKNYLLVHSDSSRSCS